MSPALIHGKVDRWLAQREAWLNTSAERRALADAWHKVAVEYGACHPAARGIVLALVREWWDDDGIHAKLSGRGGWVCCTPAAAGCGATEEEALVAALEAAP